GVADDKGIGTAVPAQGTADEMRGAAAVGADFDNRVFAGPQSGDRLPQRVEAIVLHAGAVLRDRALCQRPEAVERTDVDALPRLVPVVLVFERVGSSLFLTRRDRPPPHTPQLAFR